MTRTLLSRRFFMMGTSLGLGLAVTGLRRVGGAAAASTADEVRFIHVYLNGAWDTTLGADPRDPAGTYAGIDLGTNLLAPEFRDPTPATIGGQPTLWGPTMAALVPHADKATVFRGVNMNTVAHATGRAYVNSFQPPSGTVTRGSSIATAAAGIGDLDENLILPNVTVGLPSYNTAFSNEVTAVSLRRASEVQGLLKPITAQYDADTEGLLATAQDQARSCVSDHYPGPRPAEQLASSRARLRRLLASNLSADFDFGSATSADMAAVRARFGFPADAITRDPLNVGMTAALAAQLLRVGVSRSVTISMTPSLDTHGPEWATTQPTRQKAALDAVGALLADIREGDDPNLDRTLVVVSSEFARTGKLNGRGGRDHNFSNSILVFGSALKPGVFGATRDDNYGLEQIDLATGQPSTSGTVLLPQHIGATVISALGGDHAPFRVSPINALIPGRS
ncbi:MAG: DUF1501 domain-containing protein [Kofleriaceae bacterium]